MMKRFLALLLAMICMCSMAHAESLTADLQKWLNEDAIPAISDVFADGTVMTTTGNVEVAKSIDIAVITFSLEATADTVAEANTQVMQGANALRTALKEQGVAEDQIRQTRYDVSPNVVYHNTKLTNDQVISGYIVELTLTARIMDLNSVGKVIDAAMQSGANTSHDLVYESSNAAEAYYAALAQATKLAMEKAGLLAESCGLKLQNLMSVVETSLPQDDFAAVEVTYLAK